MSLYIIIYFVLLFFSIITYIIKKDVPVIYCICFTILTLFACFRYGQNMDYPAYEWYYSIAPDYFTTHGYYIENTHGEIGWKYLTILCKTLGLDFKYFTCIYTLIEMLLLNRFINKFCPYRTIALLLSYPTLYLTYIFSALRQGMVILVFCGILFPLLINNKLFKYFVIAISMIFLHTGAVALLLVPLVIKLKVNTVKIMFIFSFLVGLLIAVLNGGLLTSWPSLLLRIIMLIFISYIYKVYKQKKYDSIIEMAMKIYFYGQSIYIMLYAYNSNWGSRLAYQFIVLEIFIITFMLFNLENLNNLIMIFILIINTFMLFKNMNAYIWQSNYYSDVTVFNFPYVTIFNDNDIWKYRERIYEFSD